MGSQRIACLVILGLLCAGCASGYSKARIADLQDAVGLALGGGVGLSADAKLGGLTQPSLGAASTALLVGSLGRDVDGLVFERRISFPYTVRLYVDERASISDLINTTGWHVLVESPSPDQAFEMMTDPLRGAVPEKLRFERPAQKPLGRIVTEGRFLPIPGRASKHPASPTRFEFGGHVLIFAGRASFDPIELLDFLAGLAGLDFMGDDAAARSGDEAH